MKLVKLLTLGWLCVVLGGVVYQAVAVVIGGKTYVECITVWFDPDEEDPFDIVEGLGCTNGVFGLDCTVGTNSAGKIIEGTCQETTILTTYKRGKVCYCKRK